MLVLEILKTTGSPLSILTNWVLLINWLLVLKLKLIIFLTNEKITNIVTNNFSTLNNILFIEVLHFNNFIRFKFTFKFF
jgi:hypothetical protein